MRTAIVGCCDVQVVKAGGFNQVLSLETGRRGYVCALHMDEWEGPGRSACRRLCITPVDWRLREVCDGHFCNGPKMRYASSFFRIKPRERSREELGLCVACTRGSQTRSWRVAWAGGGRWGLVGGGHTIEYEVHRRSLLRLA